MHRRISDYIKLNKLFINEDLLRAFLETVTPIHAQLDKLDETNQKLRAARDLLLPRLMSGELAV